jgi:hypothetical protein
LVQKLKMICRKNVWQLMTTRFEQKQILLNSLEDQNNEIRTILRQKIEWGMMF